MHIKGSEHIAEPLNRQTGIILVSAHLGNYEMAWQFVPSYLEMQMAGVAKKMRNVRLNRLIHGIRTHFGNRTGRFATFVLLLVNMTITANFDFAPLRKKVHRLDTNPVQPA